MKIDPGGLNRRVPGLGLECFDRHPRLPQTSEAGVAELVTRRVFQTGPAVGSAHDLIQRRRRQRSASALPFQHHEHRIRRSVVGSFVIEVTTNSIEEPVRDRDQALPAALAISDKQSAFTDPDVFEAEPEDFAAPAPTHQPRLATKSWGITGVRTNSARRFGPERSRRVTNPRGTGFRLIEVSSRTIKYGQNPDTEDNRRRIVRGDNQPTDQSGPRSIRQSRCVAG
jgi:hypothetical protein